MAKITKKEETRNLDDDAGIINLEKLPKQYWLAPGGIQKIIVQTGGRKM